MDRLKIVILLFDPQNKNVFADVDLDAFQAKVLILDQSIERKRHMGQDLYLLRKLHEMLKLRTIC